MLLINQLWGKYDIHGKRAGGAPQKGRSRLITLLAENLLFENFNKWDLILTQIEAFLVHSGS